MENDCVLTMSSLHKDSGERMCSNHELPEQRQWRTNVFWPWVACTKAVENEWQRMEMAENEQLVLSSAHASRLDNENDWEWIALWKLPLGCKWTIQPWLILTYGGILWWENGSDFVPGCVPVLLPSMELNCRRHLHGTAASFFCAWVPQHFLIFTKKWREKKERKRNVIKYSNRINKEKSQ